MLIAFSCKNQNQSDSTNDFSAKKESKKELFVGFYNVENLFDIHDNPDKIDEQFLPDGDYKWTSKKYLAKLDNIAASIADMGKNGPDILGLAEVENKAVVEDLVQLTSLKSKGYKVVHEESMDMRGIDVGLIYDPSSFVYSNHKAFDIYFSEEPDYTSRAILLVEGKVNGEPLYVVVNHWPSRRGGAEESESRRIAAADKVNEVLSDVYRNDPDANILVMGDFNDDPKDKSILTVMNASGDLNENSDYLNPFNPLHDPDQDGTLTYRGKWNLFDQILVSRGLLDDVGSLHYTDRSASIHRPEFIQVGGDGPAKDMPRRAIYRGEFQENGFSDHFPVFIRLNVK